MKSKLKKILASFILMMVVYLALSTTICWELGLENPHIGLLYVLGILFGPYGALGAALANTLLDLMNGFTPSEIIPSELISFAVSYLAYKLWYIKFKDNKITKPTLDSPYHLALFLSSIIVCGLVYSAAHGALIGGLIDTYIDEYMFITYFMNFINTAFIYGVILIWLSDKINFTQTPKTSKRRCNERLYRILFYMLLIASIMTVLSFFLIDNSNIMICEVAIIGILLYCYLTKPFAHEIESVDENSILKNILRIFILITLAIAILGIIITLLSYDYITTLNHINIYLRYLPVLIITDAIIILFFIPGFIILKYIENKVIAPISSFSEIEKFIKENEKIKSKGLVDIYSEYINEQNEIGTLARSYTELINHNNNYIENIQKIEGEKKRIEAELDIATRIQSALLPTDGIENDEFIISGYSHPAKEVGGDFFDYYMIDEDNLAIVIGDASGKGVPAAILATITQAMVKQLLKNDNDPSQVLYSINNQINENNSETMFLTLWLGIYNKTTKKLIFSNAGHPRPLIKHGNEFEYLNINAGIVLGIMEDFEYENEEILLNDELIVYTDGITDANNENGGMYGESRLLSFFNEFNKDTDPISPLLNDIHKFSGKQEQFDDMTLVYLKIT